MAFTKGASGNPRGRPRGITDKVTQEIRELSRGLFDAVYWKRVKRQLDAGELNPKIEALLLNYAYGFPEGTDGKGSGLTINIGFIPSSSQQLPEAIDTVQVMTRQAQMLPASRGEGSA